MQVLDGVKSGCQMQMHLVSDGCGVDDQKIESVMEKREELNEVR